MITVTASLVGYGRDTAEADTPEAAYFAGVTLAQDIRAATGSLQLVETKFFVDDTLIRTRWL